jgi:(E)-4-hydroxy-3-methylbut-2-enyl-diphosphate synthase
MTSGFATDHALLPLSTSSLVTCYRLANTWDNAIMTLDFYLVCMLHLRESGNREADMQRRKTRAIAIGKLSIGDKTPVMVQSMTTTTALDLSGTLYQLRELQAAGCGLVRIAVPSLEAAKALAPLRELMKRDQITVPLAADVHFQPAAALEAAHHVEKVRINPGNYATDLTEARRALIPLIKILRSRGTALRIGVNHGSLAPHIASACGQGAEGMVASAMEYLGLCRELEFHQIVVALKASSPYLMVAANRLLVRTMDDAGYDYPIHLGVTEAGEGAEGTLRSVVGIGALLVDGIGDTIRVSLTGNPVDEIDACKRLLAAVESVQNPGVTPPVDRPRTAVSANWNGLAIGAPAPPRVELNCGQPDKVLSGIATPVESLCVTDSDFLRESTSRSLPLWFSIQQNDWPFGASDELISAIFNKCDGIELPGPPEASADLKQIEQMLNEIKACIEHHGKSANDLMIRFRIKNPGAAPLLIMATMKRGLPLPAFLYAGPARLPAVRAFHQQKFESLPQGKRPLLGVTLSSDIWRDAVALSSLLLTRQIDFLSLPSVAKVADAYELFQAAGCRITRAEFISCPGCGRLTYDLTEAVKGIKEKFGHLTGVRIAMMGCIVNGPGEMADADFGYVGRSRGTVDLYAHGELVRQGLTLAEADAALIDLLRARGLWREPKS